MSNLSELKLSDIVFEKDAFWVRKTPGGTFEVYKTGEQGSSLCAQIGITGDAGLQRAKDVIEARRKRDAQIASLFEPELADCSS